MNNKKFRLLAVLFLMSLSVFITGCGKNNRKKFTLSFEGVASLKIKTKAGTVVYVDPGSLYGDFSEKADLVLVTHSHEEHLPRKDLQRKKTCIEITNKEALENGEYKTFKIKDVTIEAVPIGGKYHPTGVGVGYLISFDGITVLQSGDMSYITDFSHLSSRTIDYAFYPIDGLYTMTPKKATEIADIVVAKVNIPFHQYNDPSLNQHKEDSFTPSNTKIVLEPGQTINLKTGKVL